MTSGAVGTSEPSLVAMGRGVSRRRQPEPSEWRLSARCRGEAAETFYPPDREKPAARRRRELQAKQICLSCPVLQQCRRVAIASREPHGVWGATTPRERAKMVS